jgi:tRNA (guanine10-N2)-methyltransferase
MTAAAEAADGTADGAADAAAAPSGFDAVELGLEDTAAVLPPGARAVPGRRRLMCLFLHRHLNFRLAEASALAEAAYGARAAADGLPVIVWERPAGGVLASPFWHAHLPEEEADSGAGADAPATGRRRRHVRSAAALARRIMEDAMLARCFLEPWGEGATLAAMRAAVAAHPEAERAAIAAPDQSFAFTVEVWGRRLPPAETVALIESMQPATRFEGPIDLAAPAHRFWLLVVGAGGGGANPARGSLPALPERAYMGRQLTPFVRGQRGGPARAALARFDLTKRRYLGPTSMDAELAFVMAALAGARRGALVLDPCAGTGSVLVAAAARGALTLGADIDVRVVKTGKVERGTGAALNVWTNFRDYGLPLPLGLLRADMSTLPLRADLSAAGGVLDAIAADPPYGVRAGGRKSGRAPGAPAPAPPPPGAAPRRALPRAPYPLAECCRDLADLAARALVLGGRLAFWVPAAPGFYDSAELPTHPALRRVANCEQVLSGRYSRRLVAMVKVAPYDAASAAAHYARLGPPRMAQDSMREYVYAAVKEGASEAQAGGERGAEFAAAAAAATAAKRSRGKWI